MFGVAKALEAAAWDVRLRVGGGGLRLRL